MDNNGHGQQFKCEPGTVLELLNTAPSGIALTLSVSDGTKITLQLAPGQQIQAEIGTGSVTAVIKDGDPAGLRVVG